jgi:hypothetical protein
MRICFLAATGGYGSSLNLEDVTKLLSVPLIKKRL